MQWWPHRLIPMQDAHTFAEPAMPGGSSSFSVFWGLSTKSKEFSHCLAAGSLLQSLWLEVAQPRSPRISVSVNCGLQSQCLQRSPGAVAQRALLPSLARAGGSMDSLLENPQPGVLWRVEEGICNVLIT